MNYGVPYMGSKSRIVKEVCDLFPKAENFYDLFAGGCAVTHYLLDKHKFNHFHINDISDSVRLFMDAVNGAFEGDTRWISREEFFAKKDTDPYIRYCWSFGNMGSTYMYAREIEEWKRALHHVFLLNDYSIMKKFGIEDEGMTRTSIAKNAERYREKYVEWYLKNVDSELSDHRMESLRQFGSVQNLQNLQRVQRLNGLQRMKYFNVKERLTMTMGDYQSVKIKDDSVIYCFDKDTEVLTKDGWKNVGDCTLDDYCLSRDPATDKLEWVRVVNTISYPYKGKMYSYIGKNEELCVTPNHRMFIDKMHTRQKVKRKEFVTAEELYNNVSNSQFVYSGGVWKGDDAPTIEICGQVFDKIKFARLLGIFLTDGSVNIKGITTISQKKEDIVLLLKKLFEELGMEHSIYTTKNNVYTFYIARKYLPYFEQFYLKENRKIPREVLEWDTPYLKELLEGILDGDSDKERRRIILSSKSLVDGIQELCFKVGLASGYVVIKPHTAYLKDEDRYIKGTKDTYVVSVNTKPNLTVLKNNQSWVDYDDIVNCVTLEKWHTVLVRKNGKCVWCGQCDIPYSNTAEYNESSFDYERFYDWACNQSNPVFISEYYMPDDRFECVREIELNSILSATAVNKVIEKVFVPKGQMTTIHKQLKMF